MLAAIKYLACHGQGQADARDDALLQPPVRPGRLVPPALGRVAGQEDQTAAGAEVFAGPTPIKALGTHRPAQPGAALPRRAQRQAGRLPGGRASTRGTSACRTSSPTSPGLSYLRKAKLCKLLAAEKIATEYALADSGRPSVTIRFNAITPQSVGEFIYLYEFTTSLMGELLNINAYDQPAVELGKQATFALMGRRGLRGAGQARSSPSPLPTRPTRPERGRPVHPAGPSGPGPAGGRCNPARVRERVVRGSRDDQRITWMHMCQRCHGLHPGPASRSRICTTTPSYLRSRALSTFRVSLITITTLQSLGFTI